MHRSEVAQAHVAVDCLQSFESRCIFDACLNSFLWKSVNSVVNDDVADEIGTGSTVLDRPRLKALIQRLKRSRMAVLVAQLIAPAPDVNVLRQMPVFESLAAQVRKSRVQPVPVPAP